MNLAELALEASKLRSSFREPKKIDCQYIDKQGHSHQVEHIDAAFWGTPENNKLTVLIYEEKSDESKELPF